MKNTFHKLLLLITSLTLVSNQIALGQEKDDLQRALDNIVQTKADVITTVDLSKYSDLDRVHPLYVRNGVKVRFTNGTITRTASLKDSATIVIKDKSYLDLGNSCIISGGGFKTGHEIILVEEGNLILSAGSIKDGTSSDYAVYIKNKDYSFTMTGGSISNTRGLAGVSDNMYLLNGSIDQTSSVWSNAHISGNITVGGSFYGRVYISSNLKNRINIGFLIVTEVTFRVITEDDNYEGCVIAYGDNYNLTESDLSKIIIPSDLLEKYKLVLEDNKVVMRSINSITDATTLQQAIDKAANGTAANPSVITIPDSGIDINTSIYIPANKNILIKGGPIRVTKFTEEWVFKVFASASLTLESIVFDCGNLKAKYFFYVLGTITIRSSFTCKNTSGYAYFYYITQTGTSYIYGATVTGATYGLWNEGKTYFHDGTFSSCGWGFYNSSTGYLMIWNVIFIKCTYNIYSYASFWTSGNIDFGHIWIDKSVTIYVTSVIKYTWTIHYFKDLWPDKFWPIMTGGNYGSGSSYTYTKDDDTHIIWYGWPTGYRPVYEPKCGCTQAPDLTAGSSSTVTTEKELYDAIKNATGTCSGNPTIITVKGEITVKSYLLSIVNKSIKLTGGKIIKGDSNADGLFILQDGCLTLENIEIDGNRLNISDAACQFPAFNLKSSKLIINDGTKVHDFKAIGINNYNYMAGLIWSEWSSNSSSVIMNGGSLYNNFSMKALINDSKISLSFVMNGGSITNNSSVNGVINANSFVMNAGTISGNTSKDYNIICYTGLVKHAGIIKNNYQGFLIYTTLTIEGDGSNISDRIVLNNANARILRDAKHANTSIIYHNIYNTNTLKAGTIVAVGINGYQLTSNDLNHYIYNNQKTSWKLSLSGNTIILGELSLKTPDNIQDWLDSLAQNINNYPENESKGSIEVPCSEKSIEFGCAKTIKVPTKLNVRFVDVNFIRKDDGAGLAKRIIDIPSTSTVELSNMTIDGSNLKGDEPLLVVDGTLKVDSGSVIKGGYNTSNNNGPGIYAGSTGKIEITGGEISGNTGNEGGAVVNLGTFTMSGGTISGNSSTANVANGNNSTFIMTGGSIKNNKASGYCGGVYFGENVDATLSGGEISGNDFSDVYSWSNLKLSGAMKLSIMALVNPAKMLVTSALKNNFKLHLLGDNLTSGSVFAQGTNGYTLTAQDIAKLTPGNSNYTFSLSNGNGVIKLTGTAAEEVMSLKGAYAEDGQIVLYGQQVGDPYYIYSINGQLIKSGVVKTNRETCRIAGKGVFIVNCGKNSYKVVCAQ